MSQKCPNCRADIPEQHRYCGLCGSPTRPNTVDELADRMFIVESRLNAQGDQIRNDQRVVEIETAERIAARLQRWGRMLRVWVGLPIAFVMIGLAFFVGKSFVDLADLAATSRRAIEVFFRRRTRKRTTPNETQITPCTNPRNWRRVSSSFNRVSRSLRQNCRNSRIKCSS